MGTFGTTRGTWSTVMSTTLQSHPKLWLCPGVIVIVTNIAVAFILKI